MSFKSDIEIAQEASPLPITEIAKQVGIPEDYVEQLESIKLKLTIIFLIR